MPTRTRRTTVTMAVSIVVALLFLGFAILLTGSTTTSRATSNARALHWVNATNGSIAAVRASSSQAVLFATVAEQGFGDDDAAARAYEEAAISLDRADQWVVAVAESGVENPDLATELQAFIDGGRRVLGALADGDTVAADRLFAEQLEPAWTALEVDLVRLQQRLAEEIGDSEGFSAFVAALSRIALMVVVPLAAIGVYRWRARREQEATRVRLEAELAAEQDLNRMKSQFIAGVSHELRTPLTSVVGFSHLLLAGDMDQETSGELVHGISSEAEELSRMVEDLLVASRPDGSEIPIHLEPCGLAEQVETVVTPYRRLGRDINTRLAAGAALADPVRVRQIIRNLLSNADKHGGPTVWVTGADQGSEYFVVVADDGAGVGPEASRHLFQPFAHSGQEAVVSGSVGLGLSVARQLARQMGGDLVYQRTDGWSQFILRLPAAQAAAEETADEAVLQGTR